MIQKIGENRGFLANISLIVGGRGSNQNQRSDMPMGVIGIIVCIVLFVSCYLECTYPSH